MARAASPPARTSAGFLARSKDRPQVRIELLLQFRRIDGGASTAARAMGWEIVAVVADEFRIEATSTSPFFGLKGRHRDPRSFRARRARTVIDIRSASRIGANECRCQRGAISASSPTA